MRVFWITFIFLFAFGCTRSVCPNLYPNDHLVRVGQVQVQRDIDECCTLADKYANDKYAEDAAKNIAVDGTAGAVSSAGENAASGIATGADTGSVLGSMRRGAASGGVGAAMAELSNNIFKVKDPSPAYKDCVERCLRERGYEPNGWN